MKDILEKMFQGWINYDKSWNTEKQKHDRDPMDCYADACAGDHNMAQLLHLFSHWSNDIMSLAPHYGIAYQDGKIVEVPSAPSPLHWWDGNEWIEPEVTENV
jgi:hypothetical protein